MALYIYSESKSGKNFATISKSLNCNRHFSRQYIKDWDLDRALNQLENLDLKKLYKDLVNLLSNGCSFKKACSILDVEEIVAEEVIQPYLSSNKKFIIAHRRGMTEDELEYLIAKEIVKNKLNYSECAEKLKLSDKTVSRYFLNYVRKTLVFSED